MAKLFSSNEIVRKLNISKSNFYYLLKNNVIDIPITKSGRYIWDESTIKDIEKIINNYNCNKHSANTKKLKNIQIHNRRYLGNKFKLLDFIKQIVQTECKKIHTVADIFAGTGSVASAFIDKKLITNDYLYFNYIIHLAWFGAEEYNCKKIENLLLYYNYYIPKEENYMSNYFSNTYFSIDVCRKIGFIREDIESRFVANNINTRERAILITSLLYAMDKIANTCGHYDAYIKNGKYEKELELCMPLVSNTNNENNQCYNEDANILVERIEVDLVYIDPPYNSRQYCDTYHLLENVARWEKPDVSGVALKMDRTHLKSEYCTQNATKAFEDLISKIKARYILFSYNNMAEKGNNRSNAKISDDSIMKILSKKGKVKIFSQQYKAFTAGKSNIKDNQERLFLCECYDYDKKELIQSPLNYTGGKYKLLPQILPHFPKDIESFIDLFCGGGNVGINVSCKKVVFNDKNALLRFMFGTFKNLDKKLTFELIDKIIEEYGLSNTDKYGYAFYNCNSREGLANHNQAAYIKLRNDINQCKTQDYAYYIKLFVLIVYSFNNQIRFNRKGEFNLPVGKRDFNGKMRKKLSLFIDRIKSGDYTFESLDFREIVSKDWNEQTFVYVDPPYLITCATYNEQDGWNENLEAELLQYLDNLHRRGIRFALSNVLSSKGRKNQILIDWLNKNMSEYRIIYLNHSYSNASYHKKNKIEPAEEVLVVNY